LSKNDSPIVEIFHGEFYSDTQCPNCGYVSSVHDPFMFLSVPIPQKLYSSVKLSDCLSSFEQTDTLDAKNKWKCEKCNEKVCATKKIGIYRCAPVLIIHLKRFTDSFRKIDTNVEYPLELDLTPYVTKGGHYKLIGAVFHSGGLGGGHYTAAALDQVQNKWYNFNDSFATQIDASSAISRSAYILFYQSY
jgi:ubiquitin C-terminal hydrolase